MTLHHLPKDVSRLTICSFLSVSGLLACSGAQDTELDDIVAEATPTLPGPGEEGEGATGAPSGGGAGKGGPSTGGGNGSGGQGGTTPVAEVTLCDDALALGSTDPYDAAKAMGLCRKIAPTSSGLGVIDARWIRPDGTPLASAESYGILTSFGPNVPAPAGKRMLAISSGAARAPSDPGYLATTSGHDKGYAHAGPTGYPKASSACPATPDALPGAPHDGVALELKIRVPLEAKSFSFVHQLFTSDYGEYVCSKYTDTFVVLMDPKPGVEANIVTDAAGDPVGVNTPSLLRACAPGTYKGLSFACPLGPSALAGTGFEGKAATGWLRTTVPVAGGTVVTLRFAVWDSGDGLGDTTVLLDELAFSPMSASAPRTTPR